MNDTEISSCLPQQVALALEKSPKDKRINISEIRMRVNNPATVTVYGNNYYLNSSGEISSKLKDAVCVSSEDIDNFIYKFCRGSVYAYEQTIKQGYITRNGVRVGLCGDVFLKNNEISGFSKYTSVNIRIPHHIDGVSKKIIKDIEDRGFGGGGILVVSPPGDGKTTFLRDIALNLSKGINIMGHFTSLRVCIADEKNEIFIPSLFKNCMVDVLENCPKEKAIELAIKTLNPQVLVCDEIGSEKEAGMISKAHIGGIVLIASVHGNSLEDILKYQEISRLINNKIFKRGVFLKRTVEMSQDTVYFTSESVDFYD